MSKALYRALLLGLLLGATAVSAQARQIVDMAGRKVTVPDKITKVYASQPYTNVLLYMVAPDLMLGLQPGCLPFREQDKRFLRKDILSKPWISSQGPGGENAKRNMEAILAMKPDIALATGGKSMKMNPGRIEEEYKRLKIPLVFVDVDKISGYPAAIDFMGRLLGRQTRAKQLKAWAMKTFADVDKMVKAIPVTKRVRVYYAESTDGLATEAERSFHADAIRMGGGAIVHKGDIKTHVGMEKVSMEQVLLYNPEVIIAQEPQFASFAYKDPRWKKIKAVANHRIYIVPRSPFDWIDRPPSVMRIIGVPWVAYMLYPRQYRADIRKQIKEFHSLFMGIQVTEADLNGWLR